MNEDTRGQHGWTAMHSVPTALTDAPTPRLARVEVNGTHLHVESRGDGPVILLIPGGAEDAEGWRPVAERLPNHLVITYDRRGTLRSGREDWPGQGSRQHADDAAALLEARGIGRALVFGGSSAGIIAIEMALRHPHRVSAALAFEPGYFGNVAEGRAFQQPAMDAVRGHLAAHRDDWAGGYDAFLRAAAGPGAADDPDFLRPPPGLEWYAERERGNAEALLRDDLPILSDEVLDEQRFGASTADIDLAYGADSAPVFQAIATRLARARGAHADEVEGVGHALYLWPDLAAAYIAAWARDRS